LPAGEGRGKRPRGAWEKAPHPNPLPGGEGTEVQVAQHRDRHAPVIKLIGLGEQESTVDDSIYLEGQVTDASAIVAFAIIGPSLWRRNALQLFFGQRFPLQEGENTFLSVVGSYFVRLERQDVTQPGIG